ncbi:MAG: gluconate 2-dehydrogenase subunit 3 family protein [Proteobacteria bacterium]|nr:gluconate 2-dehydrogenase subunit 3 family protein [Pseudomonadota bacterium]
MERRRFLRYAVAAPLLGAAACRLRPGEPRSSALDAGAVAPAAPCAVEFVEAARARVLSASEWQTLEALCERLLPRDADPGASDAGVINYIDAQLGHAPVSAYLPMFRFAARHLQAQARRHGSSSFAALPVGKQDQLLREVAGGRLGPVAGLRFVRVLLALTLEGFLCDPIYGGNRDGVGWRTVGFEPIEPRAHCPYRGRA